jgi:hypothetical protein
MSGLVSLGSVKVCRLTSVPFCLGRLSSVKAVVVRFVVLICVMLRRLWSVESGSVQFG